MKNGVMNKIKWFVVSILILLVAGMAVLGFVGFNNTLDYSNSYEINISLEIVNDEAKDIVIETAEKFFEDKDVDFSSYQISKTGIVYKMNNNPTSKVADLKDALVDALDDDEMTRDNEVTVKVNKVYALGEFMIPVKILLAFGIAIVAIFIYMLIMNKLASAVAVICSSIVSVLTFIALLALVRIPALPFVEVGAMISGALGAVLAVSTVGKYREILKNTTQKMSSSEIANKASKTEAKKYLIAFIGVLAAGFALFAFFTPYLMIAGGQIMLAGLAATASAFFTTPMIWAAIKKTKK